MRESRDRGPVYLTRNQINGVSLHLRKETPSHDLLIDEPANRALDVMRKRAPELLKSSCNFRASREKKNMRYERTNFSIRCTYTMQIRIMWQQYIYGNAVVGRRLFTAARSIRRIFLTIDKPPRSDAFRLHARVSSILNSKTAVKVILSRVFPSRFSLCFFLLAFREKEGREGPENDQIKPIN